MTGLYELLWDRPASLVLVVTERYGCELDLDAVARGLELVATDLGDGHPLGRLAAILSRDRARLEGILRELRLGLRPRPSVLERIRLELDGVV